jgi:hypothetical protein
VKSTKVAAFLAPLLITLTATPANANDWEKYFTRLANPDQYIPSNVEPELQPSQGNIDADVEAMWKRGFAPIGYTSFSTGNGKISDAQRLAKKLRARYYIALTELTSSSVTNVPLTLPNSTTSTTNGNFSTTGTLGYNSGTYTGTTTTYGTQTTYFPVRVNRYDKLGIYFAEVPRTGTGIRPRDLTKDEISKFETQRGFGVLYIRDGSPAYNANILPGDVVVKVNGAPADLQVWMAAVKSDAPMKVSLFRNGEPREIILMVPPEWRPK